MIVIEFEPHPEPEEIMIADAVGWMILGAALIVFAVVDQMGWL